MIQLPASDWREFLAVLRVTRWTASTARLRAAQAGDDIRVECRRSGTSLLFNLAEWQAFLAGVRHWEFLREPAMAAEHEPAR